MTLADHEAGGTACMPRRRFLAAAAAAAGGLFLAACRSTDSAGRVPDWARTAREALERGHHFLWAQQSAAGRFRSTTYGLLASGQSLTPFALQSLLQADAELVLPRRQQVLLAIRAMVEMRRSDGALGLAESSLDYPCYATAMLLSCLGDARPANWRALLI